MLNGLSTVSNDLTLTNVIGIIARFESRLIINVITVISLTFP